METKEITDRDWASSSLTKKEKILIVMLIEVIILSFGGVKQNEN